MYYIIKEQGAKDETPLIPVLLYLSSGAELIADIQRDHPHRPFLSLTTRALQL